jgi:hypothetical protein
MFFVYGGGKFQVQFSGIRSGNVEYIKRSWGDRNAVMKRTLTVIETGGLLLTVVAG